jgi:VWFA-related protein
MMKPLTLFGLLTLMTAAGGFVRAQTPQTAPLPGSSAPAAQQPPLTFRAEVNYVEVDARVLDQNGKFMTDLKPADFQVFEDGKPQKITAFSLVNIPVERVTRPLFASQPIEPDVRTNLEGADGRIYLIVLDDLHTSALRSQRSRAAARLFIEKYIGANDTAAVVYTSGRVDASQDFTNSQRRLLQAVDKFMGRKLRSSTANKIDDAGRRLDPSDPVRDIDDAERGYQARNALDTIKNLAEYLGNIRGRRKALVLFSEGIDYDITDVFNNKDATTVMDATRDVLAAATRANVAVYGVDPRGIGGAVGDELIEVQSFPDDTTLGLNTGSFYNEVRLAQDSLRVLSDETGGFAAVNRNDFGTAFQRIVDDNSSYYVMGYYSTNDRRDGRFRKIEVRVPGRPGLTVRARKGYVAARGRAPEAKPVSATAASPELREAIESPLPIVALPLATTAVVFKGPAPKGSVIVSTLVGGSSLPFVEKGGMFSNGLEVLVIATDDKGKSFPSDRSTIDLNMKPDTANRVKASGFRFISTLDLAPGRYQLRVGVKENNTKKAGSVTFDLTVPDFAKEKLSMSGVAITSALSGVAPTVRPKDPLQKLLPGPLSSYREFPPMDEIAFFAEVYDNTGNQSHKVELTATVKAEGGQTVFETKEERDSSELKGSAGGYGFTARIPLKQMAPGLYVLRIEAISRFGDRPTVATDTVFRVLPMLGAAPRVSSAQSAPMQIIATDMMSNIDQPRQAVARTPAEWAALWRQHAGDQPAPKVDLGSSTVVAVFLGSRMSAGYAVEIVGARREGNALIVQWAERSPDRGDITAQVITSPAQIVAIPKFAGEIRFEKVDKK